MEVGDPALGCSFIVQLGEETVGFSAVSGLGIELTEQRGDGAVGNHRVTDVTLCRAVTADDVVWRWVRGAIDQNERREVTITLLDAAHQPVCAWLLQESQPVAWRGPDLDALAASVAMEHLVIRAAKIRRISVPRNGRS